MKKYWLDDPKNVTKIVRLLVVVCVLLLAAGFFIELHGHFSWENWPGFFAIFGFVTFAEPQLDTDYTATFVSTDVLCRRQLVTDLTKVGFRAVCGGNFRSVSIDWAVVR